MDGWSMREALDKLGLRREHWSRVINGRALISVQTAGERAHQFWCKAQVRAPGLVIWHRFDRWCCARIAGGDDLGAQPPDCEQ